jgi:hypothetical protein
MSQIGTNGALGASLAQNHKLAQMVLRGKQHPFF